MSPYILFLYSHFHAVFQVLKYTLSIVNSRDKRRLRTRGPIIRERSFRQSCPCLVKSVNLAMSWLYLLLSNSPKPVIIPGPFTTQCCYYSANPANNVTLGLHISFQCQQTSHSFHVLLYCSFACYFFCTFKGEPSSFSIP